MRTEACKVAYRKEMNIEIGKSCFCIWIVLALLQVSVRSEETYHYVGCYKDKVNDRDLREKEITFETLTLEACASECRKDGWPYAGLQEQTKCFCGPFYNTHGEADLGACNYTCSDSMDCGGYLANSVYYTVKIDSASELQREEKVHEEVTTFENARRVCIQNDGELTTPRNAIDINNTVELAREKELTDKIWFGLMRPPSGWYVWTDQDSTVLDREEYGSYWYSEEERWQNPCVILHLSSGKWESTSCHAKYPYVCRQIPPPDGEIDTSIIEISEEETEEGPSNLALYIVLPLFTICYGGSCLIYCIGKLYKHFKKSKRMLLDKEEGFTEFEPETKPKAPPPAAVKPPPPRSGDTPVQEFNELPTVAAQTKPVYYGPGSSVKRGYTPGTPGSATTPQDSRPATSQGVTLSMGTTPRSKTPAEKMEKRREKLLQNALKEARERKKDRESKMGSRPDTRISLDSSRPDSGAIINENDSLPIPSKHKKKHKKRDSPDSGDSMTDLLSDDKNDSKPQQMSIQDIMKVKMLMKDHVAKPRRILSN